MEQGYKKFAPLALIAALLVFGVVRMLLARRKQPRSFREDPIGAFKDRSEIIAGRAQDATEEMAARMQESLEELRGRLPEFNRRRVSRRRSELNKRIAGLNEQIQALVKDLRANSTFSRS